MSDYRVVVPSYRRANTLQAKTLPALLGGGVPRRAITIYVHDNDPQIGKYAEVCARNNVMISATPARGIIAQRAYIHRQHAAGTPIVTLDDDVTGLSKLTPDGKKLTPIADVGTFFGEMFGHLDRSGLKAWGLAPAHNAFYMKDQVSDGLKFLIYTCVGYINDPAHPAQRNTVATKDDYEHSLRRWWWDGGVIRHNGVAAKAAVYTGAGGLQGSSQRSADKVEAAVAELEAQWPGLVRRNTRRKSDFAEILLSPKPRHDGHPFAVSPPGVRDGSPVT